MFCWPDDDDDDDDDGGGGSYTRSETGSHPLIQKISSVW